MNSELKRIRFLSENRPGPQMGMGYYERALIKNLVGLTRRDEWQFDVVFNGREPNGPRPGTKQFDVETTAAYLGFSTERVKKLPLSVAAGLVQLRCGKLEPSVYHSLALSFPSPKSRPGIYTIHDLPPSRFDDEGTLPKWANGAVQIARLIITPSHFAKSEIVELLGVSEAKVRVIPNGVDHEKFHPGLLPLTPNDLATLGIRSPFIIYVGGFTRRKNVSALLQAWSMIAARFAEHSLVLVGPKAAADLLLQRYPAPRVFPLGHLDHRILPQLMKAADGLVYPSIYEGFGLPPLEGMALGVPVLAVRAGAVPEVVGEAAFLIDGSPGELGDGIAKLLTNTSQMAARCSVVLGKLRNSHGRGMQD